MEGIKMKKMIMILILLSWIPLSGQNGSGLKKFFKGHAGTMVIKNMETGEVITYNAKRSKERFTPASTFKIPNSLIGLETGVIKDENFVIKWDGMQRENEDWNRNHDLASAIKYSVVPYYQELARRAGRDNEQKYLNLFDYGNKKIGSGVDIFWLDNSLKISAVGQISFLEKFYYYGLKVNEKNIDIIKKILQFKEFGSVRVKYKTGTGELPDKKYIGWLVGYIEKGKNVYLFAFNIEGKTFAETRGLRDEIPYEIFKFLKISE
jgi:beta-lactamase class D